MAKLIHDAIGSRIYETGVSHGVLFVQKDNGDYGQGVAWNGLTSVKKSPEGAEENPKYADNIKYISLFSPEIFKGTIEAYTYPDEFAACNGEKELSPGVYAGQQRRVPFGLAYKTIVGNDVKGLAYGEKIHLIYGCTAAPSEQSYDTVNDSPEAITFSWSVNSTPIELKGVKDAVPASSFTFSKTEVNEDKWKQLEDMIYGSDQSEPKMPTIEELLQIFPQ